MSEYEFGFIGAGKLAGSVIRGFLRKKVCAPGAVIASEPNADMRAELERDSGIAVTTENADVARLAATIFLGVKPQMVLPVLRDLGDLGDRLVVSFAAGIRIDQMESVTAARVMRVMTNTPALIAQAATAIAPGSRSTKEDARKLRAAFGKIGVAVEVADAQIDAVTALGGSGPAFVYAIIAALARGGEAVGLTADAALRLSAQMTRGAAEMMIATGKSPHDLIKMVVTPGGTTAAGLKVMHQGGIEEVLAKAVEAATKRGQEMARENS